MKYVRINQEVIDADIWYGQDTRHSHVEPYTPPNTDLHGTHLKCKKRWIEHGWIDPKNIKGRRAWDEGEVVCPGDYIIHDETGTSRFTIVHGPVFEKMYRQESIHANG